MGPVNSYPLFCFGVFSFSSLFLRLILVSVSVLSFKPQCVEPVVLRLAVERVRTNSFNSFSLKLSVSLPGGFHWQATRPCV